jgi:hypothetical protein
MFRALQMLCRKRRNIALDSCYASLCCKERLLRQSVARWRQRTTLLCGGRNLALYCLRRAYLRRWLRWCKRVGVCQIRLRRASLRDGVNRLQRTLRQWHVTAAHERECRHRLTVFKKLHPVPEVSLIRCVFSAWRYEYAAYRREHKQRFRAAVLVRKRYARSRALQRWYEAFECSQVQRFHLRRGMRVLYVKYMRSKRNIHELSNALILHRAARGTYASTAACTLSAFLVRNGLMVRTSMQLRTFYSRCRLRRWFTLLRDYCVRRVRQNHTYRRSREMVIQQCTQRFAAYHHVFHKHEKWIAWRGLRAWYQLQQRRLACVRTLSTRIVARQYFHRWIELYNRHVIDHTLRVPSVAILVQPQSRVVHTKAKPDSIVNISTDLRSADLYSPLHRNRSQHADHSQLSATNDAQPSIALDTSVQILQHHPAHVRQHEKSRLRALSLSTIYCDSVDTTGTDTTAVSILPHNAPRPKARYGKIIDHPALNRAARDRENVDTNRSSYSDQHAVNMARDCSHRSAGRATRVTTLTSAQGQRAQAKLWGRVIEENCIEAAKRSYTGQYLLSRNMLPIT